MGLGRRKGGEQECRISRNRETGAGQVAQAAEEKRSLLPCPGRGGLDFIKLQAAENLTICDAGQRSLTEGKTEQKILSWGL